MAIISSNIGDNEFSFRKKELRLVDSKNISEEKRNNNLNLARPLNLKDFIGQEQLKSSLRLAIEASIIRKEPLEHTLLYGQPGLGKTTLAFLAFLLTLFEFFAILVVKNLSTQNNCN